MQPDIARLASLIGEPARAKMLLALMDGRALPSGELADTANVAPQTASGHLAKLVEARLLAVEAQGRHRYYRIATPEVSFAIETLGELAPPRAQPDFRSSEAQAFRFARTCYNHLGGVLAVRMVSTMQREKLLRGEADRHCQLTEAGRRWLAGLGVEIAPHRLSVDGAGRYCLDWTERRYHLSGPLGRIILARMLELGWLVRKPATRSVRLTLNGRKELDRRLGIDPGGAV
jgi:DNA-binding transcriptional ArsR family regulator